MHINLIIGRLPSKAQLDQVFLWFGIGKCVIIENHDWQNVPQNTNAIIDISKTSDKNWQYAVDVYLPHAIKTRYDEKWFYFSFAKEIAKITPCNVVCCYYDHQISGLPDECQNDPYFDFAYIDGHWYCIDDVNADYANNTTTGGQMVMVKSIHEPMEHFLKTGNVNPP